MLYSETTEVKNYEHWTYFNWSSEI